MLRNKLDRLSDHIAKPQEKKNTDQDDRYHRLADFLKGDLYIESNGSFISITTDFSNTYAHGRNMLMDLDPAVELKGLHFGNASDETYSSDKLLFIDTETTGLGGSGTVAFLVGVGSVTETGFQVRQYFLPDYGDEEAMLEAIRAEIDEYTVLVSYNGRAFDMPILSDRMIIHRVERNLQYAAHVDLLHSARRLYRRRLKDCTLSNIEREILDFHRIDDLPGHLVPSIYFNWLSTESTDLIDKVVEHNLNDIISLYFLMNHVHLVQDDPSANVREPDDILSLARILERRRDHENICGMLDDFRDVVVSHNRFDILLMQSMAFKRRKCWTEAVALWEEISRDSGPDGFRARIELAKYHEHRARNAEKALQIAREALEICPARTALRADVQKRINRLIKKSS